MDPDPHQGEKSDPHQIKIIIRIRIRVIYRIRIRIKVTRISVPFTSSVAVPGIRIRIFATRIADQQPKLIRIRVRMQLFT
jgi:hypothetical protein